MAIAIREAEFPVDLLMGRYLLVILGRGFRGSEVVERIIASRGSVHPQDRCRLGAVHITSGARRASTEVCNDDRKYLVKDNSGCRRERGRMEKKGVADARRQQRELVVIERDERATGLLHSRSGIDVDDGGTKDRDKKWDSGSKSGKGRCSGCRGKIGAGVV